MGTLLGYEAKIHIVADVKPRFSKARPVPYSVRSLVEEEVDRLVHTRPGILHLENSLPALVVVLLTVACLGLFSHLALGLLTCWNDMLL